MTPANMTPELLDRYLAGEANAAERKAVEAWTAADSAREDLVTALRQSGSADTEAWLQRVKGTLADGNGQHAIHKRKPRRAKIGVLGNQTLRRGTWSILAVALLAVVTIMVSSHAQTDHRGTHREVPVSAYVTGNGERANITLPDGSKVTLNVASRLEVPTDYLAGNRTLRLNGEALFTVQRRSSSPFTVLAGQTTTRVLGTSFGVRHYTTDSMTTVGVREGKVAVGAVIVTANHVLEMRRNGASKLLPATPSQFSFAEGVLTLSDLLLPDAIPELNRWYDADVRLGASSLATRDVGGKFAAGSLTDLGAILELMLDARVVRHGRVLTIYPR